MTSSLTVRHEFAVNLFSVLFYLGRTYFSATLNICKLHN